MIARTTFANAPRAGRRPVEALADVVNLVWRGARAVGADVGWSVWRWHQVRQSVKVLSGLDDHMLKDIGVPRSMILSATIGRVDHEQTIRRRAQW